MYPKPRRVQRVKHSLFDHRFIRSRGWHGLDVKYPNIGTRSVSKLPIALFESTSMVTVYEIIIKRCSTDRCDRIGSSRTLLVQVSNLDFRYNCKRYAQKVKSTGTEVTIVEYCKSKIPILIFDTTDAYKE